jgi:hypothetical protein
MTRSQRDDDVDEDDDDVDNSCGAMLVAKFQVYDRVKEERYEFIENPPGYQTCRLSFLSSAFFSAFSVFSEVLKFGFCLVYTQSM